MTMALGVMPSASPETSSGSALVTCSSTTLCALRLVVQLSLMRCTIWLTVTVRAWCGIGGQRESSAFGGF
jgi:hypothetical protein